MCESMCESIGESSMSCREEGVFVHVRMERSVNSC